MKNLYQKNSLLVLLIGLSIAELSAQLGVDGYENLFIDDFRYGLFVPPDYNPDTAYHLMFYLHGSGDLTDYDREWYTEEFQDKYPTIVLTPKCEDPSFGWGNSFDHLEDPDCVVKAFQTIDSTRKYYHIDTTRMHVAGLSMGGFGTLYILTSRPGMFASAYVACGGGDSLIVDPLLDTPLWIFHGAQDDAVPINLSWDLYQNMLKAGGKKVRYSKFRDAGHEMWLYTPLESTLQDWVFVQQLGAVHEDHNIPAVELSGILNENNLPEINWTATPGAEDFNNTTWAYQIYRNSELLETVDRDSLHFIDLDALPGTAYSYQVAPMNYFFMEAPLSEEIQVVTEAEPAQINNSERTDIRIFPNPTNGILRIETTTTDINIGYQFYAPDGKLILSGTTVQGQIDLSQLKKGVYIIHLISDKEHLSRKIIKY
jgi:pimeloyl-ACP methyl ester carboxylesterase